MREINELLSSMKQFFLDSHVHFYLLNYIQNFSMSRKWENVMEMWKVFRSFYNSKNGAKFLSCYLKDLKWIH